jgi:hypothetical protein
MMGRIVTLICLDDPQKKALNNTQGSFLFDFT